MTISGIASPGLADGPALAAAVTNLNQAGYVSGLTAHAGGTQAAGLKLSQSAPLVELDTVATNGDSVLLPAAVPGAIMMIVNNGAANADVYGTLTTDTINGSTSAYVLNAGAAAVFFCAKTGSWGGL